MKLPGRTVVTLSVVAALVLAVTPALADDGAATTARPPARSPEVLGPPTIASTRDCKLNNLPGTVRPDPKGQLVLESLTGAVTNSEVASFRVFMAKRGLPSTASGNALAYGSGGTDVEALGDMYSFTDDVRILDRMLQFTDKILSIRNNPSTGRVMWTGVREPIWPTKATTAQDAGYAGAEQGDTVAHVAYAAELILSTSCLWNQRVAVGDPFGYGGTYKQRAERYVRELDKTMGYLLRYFVTSGTNRLHHPSDGRWDKLGPRYQDDKGETLPWNQQAMVAGGLQRLARCHDILGDAPDKVATYDHVVRAYTSWVLDDVRTATVSGKRVYNWGYVAGRKQPEDVGHGGYDVMGMIRAGQRGAYGLTRAQLEPYANTAALVVHKGNGQFAKNVDGSGGVNKTHLSAGWVTAARYSDQLYTIAGQAAINGGKVKTTPALHAVLLLLKDERNSG
jgi:hypothetical protein